MPTDSPGQWREAVRLPLASIASIFQHFVETICAIAVLRWVAPTQMGVWQVALLLYAATTVMRLGVVNAMARDYPFLLGAGQHAEAGVTRDTAWTYSVLFSVVVGILFLSSSLVAIGLGKDDWSKALATLAAYAVANMLIPVHESCVRGSQDFSRLGYIQVASALLSLGSLPLVARWAYDGLCLRIVVVSGLQLVLFSWFGGAQLRLRWSRVRFRLLVRSGMPLHVNNYLGLVSATVPRIAMLAFGGVADLGLFAPVGSVLAFGQAVAGRAKAFCYPQLSFMFGGGMPAGDVIKATSMMSLRLFGILLLVVMGVAQILPWLLSEYAPAYRASLEAMQWGLFASLTGALEFALVPLVVMKKHRPLLLLAVIQPALLFAICSAAALLWPSSLLVGVVVGLLTGRLIWLAISASLVWKLAVPVSS